MNSSPEWRRALRQTAAGCVFVLAAFSAAPALADPGKLDPALRNTQGTVDVLVKMRPVAVRPKPVRGAGEPSASFRARLVDYWREQAAASQAGLQAALEARGITWRSFWLVDALAVRVEASDLPWLAGRDDVARVHADVALRRLDPALVLEPAPASRTPQAVEWGVARIRAPEVWAAGVTGEGVVVAGQDTGVRWSHQALVQQYRGWDGGTVRHDYNWHDAIHTLYGGGTNPCGIDTPGPCDDHGHGTHTIGTMVGDDGGGNMIGVAPGARWIACRNMERGVGRASTYAECFQWFVAPTDLSGGNPRPDLTPDVINNSWGCPPDELCDDPAILEEVVANTREAGIVVVVSAGNSGPGCGSVDTPAAIYDAAFTVGSSTNSEAMSNFSSRGPSPFALTTTMKPDVVAPGSSIRSATRASDTAYSISSGTSMAGPHVAGAVALLIAANPHLRGDVDRIERILSDTAVPLAVTQTCGGIGPDTWPNYVAGHGRIDVWAAFRVAETIFADGWEAAVP